MAENYRTHSIDSGLLSDQVTNSVDETNLKPVFSSNNTPNTPKDSQSHSPHRSRSYTHSHHFPNQTDAASRRKSFQGQQHGGFNTSKTDSDSDIGIVPDITKMLLGNRQHKRHKNTDPTSTYSIHINTLYVYQNPTMPVENPIYQQLPVEKHDEKPPSPCPKPGYQYVWPKAADDIRLPQQHHDSTDGRQSRPTSLNVSSSEDSYKNVYAKPMKEKLKKQDDKPTKDEAPTMYFSMPSSNSPEVEEMEILIKNKGGKSRRYKLQPIQEDPKKQDPYVLNASSGERGYIIDGFTINNDNDEAFSDSVSLVFPDSSSTSQVSEVTSGTAIDTIVGDCKITVNQAFNSLEENNEERGAPPKKIPTSASMNDVSYINDVPPKNHRLKGKHFPTSQQNLRQTVSMNDPTYFDFEEAYKSNPNVASNHSAGYLTRSVPNMVSSRQIETCYECRSHRHGGLFSSKQRTTKTCTLEGYHNINDENEISLIRDILDNKGKLGHWFISPTTNQPGYCSNLYVKTKREVTSFPVVLSKKKKVFIDLNTKKSFLCLCKLTEYYKSNHLPSVNINLGQPLPHDWIPAMNFGADGEGTLKEQYAGIRL